MKKRILSIVICLVMLVQMVQVVNAGNQSFTDLPSSHWAYSAVQDMVSKGVLTGFEDGTFRPNDAVTREQFAKVMVLALNLPLKNSGTPTFSDVSKDDWSYQYVESAKKYLTGYKENGKMMYIGSGVAVREDMAVAMVTAKGLQTETPDLSLLNNYTDKESISQSLRGFVAIAIKNKIMEGDGTKFNPQNTLTRAEACALIYKASVNVSGEKVAIVDENVGTEYKVYNDGNVTFNYPSYISFKKSDMFSNNGYIGLIGKNENVEIQLLYYSIDDNTLFTDNNIKVNTLEGIKKAYSTTGNLVKKLNNCVVEYVEDSDGSIWYEIFGRGIGKMFPDVRIFSNDSEKLNEVKTMIVDSFKVINPNQPYKGSVEDDSELAKVVNTTPVNGASNVSNEVTVTIQYSRDIAGANIKNSYYINKEDNKSYLATGQIVGNKIIYSPLTNLEPGKEYEFQVVQIGNYIEDCIFTFTTKPDDSGLTITKITPANGETNVNPNLNVVYVEFSKNVNVSIYPSIYDENGRDVATGESGQSNYKEYPVSLQSNTKYKVVFSAKVLSDGTKFEGGTYMFTTGDAEKIEDATVVDTNPKDGATNISTSLDKIVINYSYPITIQNQGWIQSFTHVQDQNNNDIPFTAESNGTVLTLTLSKSLEPNTKYNVSLPTMLMVSDIPQFSQSYTFSFTTGN